MVAFCLRTRDTGCFVMGRCLGDKVWMVSVVILAPWSHINCVASFFLGDMIFFVESVVLG